VNAVETSSRNQVASPHKHNEIPMAMFVIASALGATLLMLTAGYLFGLRAGARAPEQSRPELDGLRSMIEEVLGPVVERQRAALDLEQFAINSDDRRDLTQLLDRIAAAGNFKHVLLSNDEGLPLAANSMANDIERLATTVTRFALVAGELAGKEEMAPASVLLRDISDETMICRIFRASGQRLFLAAQSSDPHLNSTALDPAITKIAAALSMGEIEKTH